MPLLDEFQCPICGADNGCKARTIEQATCWCMTKTIPENILQAVPKESKGKQCICQNCIDTFKSE
ncbi:cysteine-rich CWC family protein [Solibacillus sp. CAU 1738]|uniref:cysteine-rich CWC family protein n=1 Tax=Solibacillus sp. CAU 1738 TaxID=3140363 RepID=UPI003260A35B